MANAQSIILHQFERSPFSEKIRLALRMKNLGWAAVEIPSILPKPDLMPLTGGYRRTPVMQIGADIFCDTSIMLVELEKRFQIPALDLPGHEGLSRMVSAWTDGKWFQTSVAVIFGTIGEHMPQAFIDDRTKMSGRPFDIDAMKAAVPFMKDQWRSQLMWIEHRLAAARTAGTGDWLIGSKPGLVDVHAFMNPWFVEKNVPDFLATCFAAAPLSKDWYQRLKDFKGQAPEEIEGAAAIQIAHDSAPRLKPASTAGDIGDFQPGDRVAIAPDDYAKDWVEGDLVIANSERVIIARQDERADNLHIHFPRVGYVLRSA
ncbi:MAG: glutathione S-transferase [Hyphomonadaceae bacterium]|nr:glutathione S-transferase [Hyphomonadaceae bacterium]